MFRSLRVLLIAAVIAVSLSVASSTASADTITVRIASRLPIPTLTWGITWE